ncbi:hypothetical protein Tco_0424031 [Tanacetum coccineum]
MSVKYPNYVNLTSLSEEQPNERTPSPPPRKKSLSPPQAPSKSISSKSTHYTSSSSPSESPTPTHVATPPKFCFVIPIKLEPQELPPPQMSPNDPYAQTMDNWLPVPSNPSPPPRVSRPPLGFPNPPPGSSVGSDHGKTTIFISDIALEPLNTEPIATTTDAAPQSTPTTGCTESASRRSRRGDADGQRVGPPNQALGEVNGLVLGVPASVPPATPVVALASDI